MTEYAPVTMKSSAVAVTPPPSPTKKKQQPLPKERVYVVATAKDVLPGRGGIINHHPGNIHLRKVVHPLERKYRSLNVRGQKGQMGRRLVKIVHRWGGRFLGCDGTTDINGNPLYYELSLKSAVRLVQQKFRDDPDKKSEEKTNKNQAEPNLVVAAQTVPFHDDNTMVESSDPVRTTVPALETLNVACNEEPGQSGLVAIAAPPVYCVKPTPTLEDVSSYEENEMGADIFPEEIKLPYEENEIKADVIPEAITLPEPISEVDHTFHQETDSYWDFHHAQTTDMFMVLFDVE